MEVMDAWRKPRLNACLALRFEASISYPEKLGRQGERRLEGQIEAPAASLIQLSWRLSSR
jgi:hypothetical protein